MWEAATAGIADPTKERLGSAIPIVDAGLSKKMECGICQNEAAALGNSFHRFHSFYSVWFSSQSFKELPVRVSTRFALVKG